jgi:hypothetical protein
MEQGANFLEDIPHPELLKGTGSQDSNDGGPGLG